MRVSLHYAAVIAGLVLVIAVPLAQPGRAQTYQVLHTFTGGSDGDDANAGLARAADGALFGTTRYGGGCENFDLGCGVVFRIGTDGKESVLYAFKGENDGAGPNGVIISYDGSLYGTTGGTVFRLSRTGKLRTLHTFTYDRSKKDGLGAMMPLVQDAKGNLYGTTIFGGGGGCPTHAGSQGCGVVFTVSPKGKFAVLHRFSGWADGAFPNGLVRGSDGSLYGTTQWGGNLTACDKGCGTVFRLSRQAGGRWKKTVVHSFGSWPDAGYPEAGVILDSDGNIYGTTYAGGINYAGAVFEVDNAGGESVLYSFCQLTNCADGAGPYAPVTLDAEGNLYGTTYSGGEDGNGTVFKLTRAGTESVLFKFSQGTVGGWYPYAGVIRDAEGRLYGTTVLGGDPTCDCGVTFKLTP